MIHNIYENQLNYSLSIWDNNFFFISKLLNHRDLMNILYCDLNSLFFYNVLYETNHLIDNFIK
jgi:hypothetical protein